MTDGELADKLLAWSTGELTEIVGKYDHEPRRHTQGFPEVGIGVRSRSLTDTVPGVGRAGEQRMFDMRRCEIVVAVKPEPVSQQVDALRDFVGRLLAALRRDRTLGSRVEVCSPLVDVDYEAQIAFDDGTDAQGFTMNLMVADRVPAP